MSDWTKCWELLGDGYTVLVRQNGDDGRCDVDLYEESFGSITWKEGRSCKGVGVAKALARKMLAEAVPETVEVNGVKYVRQEG